MEEYQGLREEVDFLNLIFYILERWRWILVSMLIFGLLAGGYKAYSVTNVNLDLPEEKEIKKEQDAISRYEEVIQRKKSDLAQQEQYLSDSTVMNIDSHHVSTGTLNYYIESESDKNILMAAYAAYVSSGELAEQLYAVEKCADIEDLQYLISFEESSSNNNNQVLEEYTLSNDDVDETKTGDVKLQIRINNDNYDGLRGGDAVFQIKVKMPDSDMCEKYLNLAEQLIEKYSLQLNSQVAEHKLLLLSSVRVEMIDSELQRYQSDAWAAYLKSVSYLEKLYTNEVRGEEEKVADIVSPISAIVKYGILGLGLGAFFSFFVLLLLYLLGDRLQDTEHFKSRCGIPLLGIVRIPAKKNKLFGFIDKWIFRLREKTYANISVEEQIRIAAANTLTSLSNIPENGNVNKLMLAGTIPEQDVDLLYTKLTAEMGEIYCSPYMQIVFQASALKELDDYDGILFLEKRGVSHSQLIIQEKKLASERGVKVLGAIVIS